MFRLRYSLVSATVVLCCATAFADLQNVKVGGSLRIARNAYSVESGVPLNGNVGSILGWDRGNNTYFTEQRTRLNVEADFTDHVRAFIEFDSYDIYGEDFRSDYITGVDGRAASGNDVELYQSFIELDEILDIPLSVRIGRQEIMLGSEWLVGNNDTASFFQGLSFDGVRVSYTEDTWWVTAFATKLAENSPIEEDGDVDFYGLYGGYTGLEDIVIEAYYLFLRDARGSRLGFPFDTPNVGLFGYANDTLEDFFGVDQYSDTSQIHTLGARVAGSYGQFDFEGEFAWQRAEAANTVKLFFSPDPATSIGTPYGEDDAEYRRLAANVEAGYTFDTRFQPRLFAGWAWFEGEDRREESFGDWLHTFYPFHETDASLSFNRLFSDWEYSNFIDFSDLSNAMIFRVGIEGDPWEKVHLKLEGGYYLADAPTTTNGVFGIPFWGVESDDELGWEASLTVDYDLTEDLKFRAGYAHFFAADGIDNNSIVLPIFFKVGGNFVRGNGLIRAGGIDNEDADYWWAETSIKF